MMEGKLKKIQDTLKKNGIDAYLIYDFRGRNSILKVLVKSHYHITRKFLIIISQDEIIKIVPSIEKDKFNFILGEKKVYRTYKEFFSYVDEYIKNYSKVLIDVSFDNNLPVNDIVPYGFVSRLLKNNVEILESYKFLNSVLSEWDQQQKRSHLNAVEVLKTIFTKASEYVSDNVGKVTDNDIKQLILSEYVKYDMTTDGDDICIVATNKDIANPHYVPTENNFSMIKPNSLILIDMWARLDTENSVYADFTHLFWIGPEAIPSNINDTWNKYIDTLNKGVSYLKDKIKKGLCGYEVDKFISDQFKELNFSSYIVHRSGHSLGEKEHGIGTNFDNLETKDIRRIEPNQGYTLEPGLYIEGEFGIRTEIDLYIDENYNVEITTPFQQEIIKLPLK